MKKIIARVRINKKNKQKTITIPKKSNIKEEDYVELKKFTGLPTIAWASIFAPYLGTKLGKYCLEHGFYSGTNEDIPTSFFQESTLNFTNSWVGPNLLKQTQMVWMNNEEKAIHKNKLNLLRNLFTSFALVPQGDKLAKDFLNAEKHSFDTLSEKTRHHLYNKVLYKID